MTVELEVWCDETYPSYGVFTRENGNVSLSQEEYDDYRACCERYEAWQAKLENLYLSAPKPAREDIAKSVYHITPTDTPFLASIK